MLAVDPELKSHEIEFRESMKKFDSGRNSLDIINITDYIPCYLNRQIISILSSLGIADSVFSDLQDTMLKSTCNILVDGQYASQAIKIFYKNSYNWSSPEDSKPKINYLLEPYFKELLMTIQRKLLDGLMRRSRIFIKKGRILMGVIDETQTLGANEVFIQCTLDDNDDYLDDNCFIGIKSRNAFIVKKKVIVAKNPCMHPGDVRIVNAVDARGLRHLVDCIVFPATGARPLTNMCSGSDLDGDLYFASWEDSLIPMATVDPMDYTTPQCNEKLDGPIGNGDIVQFFVDFIKTDQMGRIANAHVAIADSSKLGVKDPLCIELAKAFSLAVDFPKTGIVPEIPESCKKIKYPDFMGKWHEDSYESEKIIGKMYRKCKQFSEQNQKFSNAALNLNSCLLYDGYETYLKDAILLYEKYRHSIETLMVNMNCKTESELMVGLSLDSSLSNSLRNSFKTAVKYLQNLFTLMRQAFFGEFGLDHKHQYNVRKVDSTLYRKASAWYIACYKHEANIKLKILSFPWIVDDILSHLHVFDRDCLSESILREYINFRDDYHSMSRFIQKIELKREIVEAMDLDLVLGGTYGLFLFENNNEIQLYATRENVAMEEYLAENLMDYYDNVTLLNKDLIKCQHDDDVTFTVHSYDKSALLTFLYVRRTIMRNPLLLPVLYTIVHYIRTDNIFLLLNSENVKLDCLIEYFIDFLILTGFIRNSIDVDATQTELDELHRFDDTVDVINEWIEFHDSLLDVDEKTNQIGLVLIRFYKHMAFEFDFFAFKSKFNDQPVSHDARNKNFDTKFRKHFLNVFNQLVHATDLSGIWDSVVGDNSDETAVVNRFRQRFKVSQKKRGKSNTLFANEASLLTFSNIKSSLDFIEFQLYTGKYLFLAFQLAAWVHKLYRQ